jgi:hypothetical protein
MMMTRSFTRSFVVLTVLAGSLVAAGNASAEPVRITRHTEWTYASADTDCGSASSNRVVYKAVQNTQEYDMSRPEVPSGARLTLFANFLGSQTGYVMFNLNGTSTQCEVIDWKDNSVTAVLPKLGLLGPKNAEIQLVKPDGRIVKAFRVLFVSQPDVLVHSDTVPQPLPPAPAAEAVMYAAPVSGGVALYSK